MSRPFTCLRVICFFAFVCGILVSTLGYAQANSEALNSPKDIQTDKKENFRTYPKSGSDSISLIVFGRILIKSFPGQTTPLSSDDASKTSNKKEKFSIKSTDKLKTDNALY